MDRGGKFRNMPDWITVFEDWRADLKIFINNFVNKKMKNDAEIFEVVTLRYGRVLVWFYRV